MGDVLYGKCDRCGKEGNLDRVYGPYFSDGEPRPYNICEKCNEKLELAKKYLTLSFVNIHHDPFLFTTMCGADLIGMKFMFNDMMKIGFDNEDETLKKMGEII